MKNDRRAVISLPVKILVIMVILAVMVPIVVNAAENSEKSIKNSEMGGEVSKIIDAVSVVYHSGVDSQRILDIDVPTECEISIGGEGGNAFSIRMIYKGEIISTKYFENPEIAIGENLVLSGNVSLCVKCVGAGVFDSVEITIL